MNLSLSVSFWDSFLPMGFFFGFFLSDRLRKDIREKAGGNKRTGGQKGKFLSSCIRGTCPVCYPMTGGNGSSVPADLANGEGIPPAAMTRR